MISQQHFDEITNGYEKRSSGLWTHKGVASASGLRAVGPLLPNPSNLPAGAQLQYDPVAGIGYVQAYDYANSTYKDLVVAGRNVAIQATGTFTLPPLGTSQIQANAVQQLLGSYVTATGFTSTLTSSWILTPVAVAITTGGGLLRIEMTTTMFHSVAGGGFYTGIGWDGAVQQAMTFSNAPAANYYMPISWVFYSALPAGPHTIQLYILNGTTGTLGFNGAVSSILYVTEQKR